MTKSALKHVAKTHHWPCAIVRVIEDFACDWMLHEVKKNGGTPSRLGLLPFTFQVGVYPDFFRVIFSHESYITVQLARECANGYEVPPPSREVVEHWIRAPMEAAAFCVMRAWNYEEGQYSEFKTDFDSLWYQCESC